MNTSLLSSKRFNSFPFYGWISVAILSILVISFGCKNNSGISEAGDVPQIMATFPANNATDVAISTTISARFNDEMNPETITDTSFTLRIDSIAVQGSISYGDSTANFSPFNDLEFNREYTVTITTGAQNLSGSTMGRNYEWTFTTVGEANAPPAITSTNPANNATGVSINTAVIANFNEPVNPSTLNESSFFLEQGDTRISANVSYGNATATLTPINPLVFGTTYTATLSTAIEDTSGNALSNEVSWNFTTANQPDNAPPQVASTDPTNNENNVAITANIIVTFNEAISRASITDETFFLEQGNDQIPGTFSFSGNTVILNPNANLEFDEDYTVTLTTDIEDLAGNNLGSAVEWEFNTSEEPDDQAPEIDSFDPDDNEDDVPIDTDITVEFDEPINPATVNNNSFVLEEGNTDIPGTFSFNASGQQVTFTPSANLEYETTYTVTVTTGIEDAAGNNLEDDAEWEFETEEEPDEDDPEVDTRTPGINQQDVAINTNIIVTFNEAIEPATINNSTFLLEAGDTQIPAGYNTSGSTATLNPNNNLDYQTVYTATLTTGIQDLAGNGLTTTAVWDFTTNDPPDTTPPTVDAMTPTDNADNIAISTNITATFSEAMNEQSVENAFSISPSVPGNLSFAGNTLTFNPNADLGFSTSYTVTISTGAQDLAGNSLASSEEWNFTTTDPPDTTPPMIILTSPSPADGDTNVLVTTQIQVQFDEAIDPVTIDNTTFIVVDGSTIVTGNYNTDGNTIIFTPSADLSAGATQYEVTINSGVADLAGNNYDGEFVWSFVTEL